jgi:hypothetical protein
LVLTASPPHLKATASAFPWKVSWQAGQVCWRCPLGYPQMTLSSFVEQTRSATQPTSWKMLVAWSSTLFKWFLLSQLVSTCALRKSST